MERERYDRTMDSGHETPKLTIIKVSKILASCIKNHPFPRLSIRGILFSIVPLPWIMSIMGVSSHTPESAGVDRPSPVAP